MIVRGLGRRDLGTSSARPADWPAWLFLAQATGKARTTGRHPRDCPPSTARTGKFVADKVLTRILI